MRQLATHWNATFIRSRTGWDPWSEETRPGIDHMAKPARAGFTVRSALALPFEERTGTKAHQNNELSITALPKQRLLIAMPCHMRFLLWQRFKFAAVRTSLLSTPWLHQGCDSPPQPRKQAPRNMARYLRLAHTNMDKDKERGRYRPKCAVRAFTFPTPSLCKSRQYKPPTSLFSPNMFTQANS